MAKKSVNPKRIYGIEASLALSTLFFFHLTHNRFMVLFMIMFMVWFWFYWWRKQAQVLRPFVREVDEARARRESLPVQLPPPPPSRDHWLGEVKDLDS